MTILTADRRIYMDTGSRVRPNGKSFAIREQIIDERNGVSGLCLWIRETSDGFALTIVSDLLEFGNRDFFFGTNGELGGAGCGMRSPEPNWLREVPA
jgi:hypothetical protein